MQKDQQIYEAFAHGGMKYLDAIEALQTLGLDPQEAERVVSEWADALEPRHEGEDMCPPQDNG